MFRKKKNGLLSHHLLCVGIKTNIMNGIRLINEKKSSIIFDERRSSSRGNMESSRRIIMKKNGFHHGIYKETIT